MTGCGLLRNQSDVDRLVSMINKQPDGSKPIRITPDKEDENKPTEDEPEFVPFQLPNISEITGSGVHGANERNSDPRVAVSEPAPATSTRNQPERRRLAEDNPLRPIPKSISKRSLEELVNQWADAGNTDLPSRSSNVGGVSKESPRPQLIYRAPKGSSNPVKTAAHECESGDPDCQAHVQLILNSDSEKAEPKRLRDKLLLWTLHEGDDDPVLTDEAQVQRVAWNEKLKHTVEVLTADLESDHEGAEAIGSSAKLRLLRLLSGNISHASEPVKSFSSDEQQSWIAQMAAVDNMLLLAENQWDQSNEKRRRELVRRCTEQLRQALVNLAGDLPLEISNCELCSAIHGFGQYTTIEPGQIRPGHKVLLYCEIENLVSKKTLTSNSQFAFETEFSGQVRILDDNDREIKKWQFDSIVDRSRRIRRDYFAYVTIEIPELESGVYRVETRIEDKFGNQTSAQNECRLEIVSASK